MAKESDVTKQLNELRRRIESMRENALDRDDLILALGPLFDNVNNHFEEIDCWMATINKTWLEMVPKILDAEDHYRSVRFMLKRKEYIPLAALCFSIIAAGFAIGAFLIGIGVVL